MKIYLDDDFKCYTNNSDGNLLEVETDIFDGKCDTFIKGYRYVPAGENWIRSDDTTFHGEMIAPWKPYDELIAAQREYEQSLLSEYSEALTVLGVEL